MGKDKSKNPVDQFRKQERKKEQKKNKAKKDDAIKSTLKTHDAPKLKEELTRLELLLKQERITDAQRAQRKRIRSILSGVDLKLVDQNTNMLMKQIKQLEKEEQEEQQKREQESAPTFVPPPPPPGIVLPAGFVIPPPPIAPPTFKKPVIDQKTIVNDPLTEESRWIIKDNTQPVHDPIQERIDAIKRKENQKQSTSETHKQLQTTHESQIDVGPALPQHMDQPDVGPPLPPSMINDNDEDQPEVGPSMPPSSDYTSYPSMPSMDDFEDDSVVGPAMPDMSNYYYNEDEESVTAPYPMINEPVEEEQSNVALVQPIKIVNKTPLSVPVNNQGPVTKKKVTVSSGISKMVPPSLRRNVAANQSTVPKRNRTGDILMAQHASQNVQSATRAPISSSMEPKTKKPKLDQDQELAKFMNEMNGLL